jgi:hypothetical protein
MPRRGNAEKAELERVILERLTERYDAQGPDALLVEGLRVVVNGSGITLDMGEARDPLAAIEVRSLFTAICYVSSGTLSVPHDALASLAREATGAVAAQVNRIASR